MRQCKQWNTSVPATACCLRAVLCWGANADGQCGTGVRGGQLARPTPVAAAWEDGAAAIGVTCGDRFTLVRTVVRDAGGALSGIIYGFGGATQQAGREWVAAAPRRCTRAARIARSPAWHAPSGACPLPAPCSS